VSTNYQKIINANLLGFYNKLHKDNVEKWLGSERKENGFRFRAFGEDCFLNPEGITLSGSHVDDPKGLLISLYALHGSSAPLQLEPFKSFKDFPGSMPYHGAFSTNSERILVPHVHLIREKQRDIEEIFDGREPPPGSPGDFSFLLYPLPKIPLFYIFYIEDDDFPASATCLFAANALSFMPLDGLADVAEVTSRSIIEFIRKDFPERNDL
jgi:hypothetical protein